MRRNQTPQNGHLLRSTSVLQRRIQRIVTDLPPVTILALAGGGALTVSGVSV